MDDRSCSIPGAAAMSVSRLRSMVIELLSLFESCLPRRPAGAAPGFAALVIIGLASGTCLAAAIEIGQTGQRFSQSKLSVVRGQLVHFTNHDDVVHNISVFDADGIQFDEGLQNPGEIIAHDFDKIGTFVVRCGIHPQMKIKVTVD